MSQDFRSAIMRSLGRAPELIEPGRFHRFATSERRGDDAGWCKLFDDLRGGMFGCYRRGISETWCAADRTALTREQRAELARQVSAATAEREAQQRSQWTENAQRIEKLWAQCVSPTRGDPVAQYLRRRGLADTWPLPEVLRLHRALPYWNGAEKLGTFPAMVAPLVTPEGHIVSLHRTYLTTDGNKADVPTPKKLTGAAGPLTGACIPLQKPMQGRIGIAEGIETALAAWAGSGVPTVAAYCANALAGYLWPAGVRRLVIFADADKAGREAAQALQSRARAGGLRYDVLCRPTEGNDWADVWAARDAALIETECAA